MQAVATELKAWIPFANQNNAVRKLYDKYPAFVDHMNEQIPKLHIPLAFDYEQELVKEIAHELGKKPIGSFARLWDFQKRMVGKFREQRIVHLIPEQISMRGDFIGVEFRYSGTMTDDKWLPKDIKVVGNFYPGPTDTFKAFETMTAKELTVAKHSTLIYAFLAEPFN